MFPDLNTKIGDSVAHWLAVSGDLGSIPGGAENFSSFIFRLPFTFELIMTLGYSDYNALIGYIWGY